MSPSISNKLTGAAAVGVLLSTGGRQLWLKFRRSISGTGSGGLGGFPSIILCVGVGLAEWSLSEPTSLANYKLKKKKFIQTIKLRKKQVLC